MRKTSTSNSVFFIDPEQFSFSHWDASVARGYRFDYEENDIRVTVEVETLHRGHMLELGLRVVDDAHSRDRAPRVGDRFRVSCVAGQAPFHCWFVYPEGHFARYAAWRRDNGI